MIGTQVKDPRVAMVTLTGVDITPDYAYATVHFTVLPSDERTVAQTLAGLEHAAGFLRGQLRERVRIHTTPQLRFALDRSVEHGIEMSQLIDQANARRAEDLARLACGRGKGRTAQPPCLPEAACPPLRVMSRIGRCRRACANLPGQVRVRIHPCRELLR